MIDEAEVGSNYAESHRDESLALHQQRRSRQVASASRRHLLPPGERKCDECGEPIDPKRLACEPHAECCTTCGSKRERRGR